MHRQWVAAGMEMAVTDGCGYWSSYLTVKRLK